MYANDNDDWLPESLASLYPKYVSNAGLFACPKDEEMVKLWRGVHDPDEVRRLIGEDRWSYEYLLPCFRADQEGYSSEIVIMLDKSFCHPSGGYDRLNVLLLDGGTEGVGRERLLELLKTTLDAKNLGKEQKAHVRTLIERFGEGAEPRSPQSRPQTR